jgi:radical SAM superfamily enzyme YgiQ (UPF0313 family)
MRILLADLFHDYRPNHICVPLGVGFVSEYLKSLYTDNVSVNLFKSPERLLDAARTSSTADIVGLSNYSWNAEINKLIINRLKIEYPDTVIISGGPHIRTDNAGILLYLKQNPDIDYYLMFEGEFPTGNLVGRMLQDGRPLKPEELGGEPISGVAYLYKDELIYQPRAMQKEDLEKIPSPILSGALDEFLVNPHYLPLLETNRGCPFACTFCAWGISVLNKVRKFDYDRIVDEINYVANISPASNWYFTDANFGMFPRDVDIARTLRKVADESPHFQRISINWAKNSSKYCTEIAHVLRGICDPLVAVQSTDKEVLKNIKRANIKEDTMSDLVEQGRADGIAMTTDVLAGLSGESLESHMNTLRDVFALGFESFNVGPIRMLPGSEMETLDDREKFGIKTKYRYISGFFGIYDGEPVCEFEESVVATNTMSQEDMYTLRVVHFLAWALWNSGLAQPLLRYMFKAEGINPLDAILSITHSNLESEPEIKEFLDVYISEARTEWFDSEEELLADFQNNHEKLLNQEYLKLNLKFLSKILLNSDLARKILNVVAKNSSSNIVNELVDFSMERIFFINSRVNEKNINFSPALIEGLSIIYPSVSSNGNNVCKFSVTPKFYRVVDAELERFMFNENSLRALTLTLQNYGDKLMYDFSFGDTIEKTGSEVFFDSFDYSDQLKPNPQ